MPHQLIKNLFEQTLYLIEYQQNVAAQRNVPQNAIDVGEDTLPSSISLENKNSL